MHSMTDRLENMGGKLRERRSTSKIEHLDDENERLRMELRSMKSMLDQERSEREDILGALKGRPKTVVKKKRGGLIRMVVIGGGAYVLGTRAGRSRYEQIVEWAKSMKDRGRDTADDFRSDVVSAGNGGSKIDPEPAVPTAAQKPAVSDSKDPAPKKTGTAGS